MRPNWIYVDFMRLHDGGLAFLSAEEEVKDERGDLVPLEEGMPLTVFDGEYDQNGRPNGVFATGEVVKAPHPHRPEIPFFWFLKIDSRGIRNVLDEKKNA